MRRAEAALHGLLYGAATATTILGLTGHAQPFTFVGLGVCTAAAIWARWRCERELKRLIRGAFLRIDQ